MNHFPLALAAWTSEQWTTMLVILIPIMGLQVSSWIKTYLQNRHQIGQNDQMKQIMLDLIRVEFKKQNAQRVTGQVLDSSIPEDLWRLKRSIETDTVVPEEATHEKEK